MPKLSEADRAARQQVIVDGARRAFAKWGYAGTTVRRLEEETGRSRGAIFNWFDDKWALFLAVSRDDQRRAFAMTDDDGGIFSATTTVGQSALTDHLGAYLEAMMLIKDDPAKRADWEARNHELEPEIVQRWQALLARGELRRDVTLDSLVQFASIVNDGMSIQRALGVEFDAAQLEGITALLRTAMTGRPEP